MSGNLTIHHPITLEGTELSIVALDDVDYIERMQFHTFKNGSVVFSGGMCFELMLVLKQALKFEYKPLRVTHWTRQLPNGTFTEMSGSVINGQADLAIGQASMVMMQQPIRYISYLLPTSVSRLAAIFRQPKATRDLLLTSFELNAWIGISLTWIAIILTLKLIIYFKKLAQTQYKKSNSSLTVLVKRGKIYRDNLNVFLWFVATVANQGWHEKTKEGVVRIIFIVALIFTILFNNTFSASLTSMLATEKISIRNFEDLTNSNLIIYGDFRLPVARLLVESVYHNKRSESDIEAFEKHFIYLSDSIKRVVSEDAAFITFEEAAKNNFRRQGYREDFFCRELNSVLVSGGVIANAMFVKRGSYLKEVFNRKITLINERGVTARINNIYNLKTLTNCAVISQKYRGGLSVLDISTAIIVMLGGLLLSTLAVIFESVCKKS